MRAGNALQKSIEDQTDSDLSFPPLFPTIPKGLENATGPVNGTLFFDLKVSRKAA
jgi:hypothetical protein